MRVGRGEEGGLGVMEQTHLTILDLCIALGWLGMSFRSTSQMQAKVVTCKLEHKPYINKLLLSLVMYQPYINASVMNFIRPDFKIR